MNNEESHGPSYDTAQWTALDAIPDQVCVSDAGGAVLHANRAWLKARGLSLIAAVGKPVRQFDDAVIADLFTAVATAALIEANAGFEQSSARVGSGGSDEIPRFQTTISPLCDAARTVVGTVIVTRHVKEAANAEYLSQLLASVPLVFWIADAMLGRLLYVSAACQELLGASAEDVLQDQRLLVSSVHPEDRRAIYEQRRKADTGAYDATYRIMRPDGGVRWAHDRAFPVFDAAGRVYRIVGVTEDITHRKNAERQLMEMAHFDSLSGLPNRSLFYDRLQQAIALSQRTGIPFCVMFLDVDRFKVVNDSLGHAAGDELLKTIAERLMGCIRANDTAARLGGDEFALILHAVPGSDEAAILAAKILGLLNAPVQLRQIDIPISVSIGVTISPTNSADPSALVRQADVAMYRAKELGRDNFQFYSAEMDSRLADLVSLESDLRRAIERGEFTVHDQPKVSLSSGCIVAVEALARWQHPRRGLVYPGEFMSVLEETGLIVPAGKLFLRAICSQIQEWRNRGGREILVCVNVSARQFLSPDLGAIVNDILHEFNIPARLLELEITESCVMVNAEEAVRTLDYLRSLGVAIAIDDFGTGYSSLAYLKRFPLSALKIDKSFIRDITTDSENAAITQAIVSMGHALGLSVIAEGVETREQLGFLRDCSCDLAQGYFFARPMPPLECERAIVEDDGLRCQ